MLKLTFSTTSTSQIKNMRKFLMFPLRTINENINEKFSKRPKRFFLLHSELVNRKKKKKDRHNKEIWSWKTKFVLPL